MKSNFLKAIIMYLFFSNSTNFQHFFKWLTYIFLTYFSSCTGPTATWISREKLPWSWTASLTFPLRSFGSTLNIWPQIGSNSTLTALSRGRHVTASLNCNSGSPRNGLVSRRCHSPELIGRISTRELWLFWIICCRIIWTRGMCIISTSRARTWVTGFRLSKVNKTDLFFR